MPGHYHDNHIVEIADNDGDIVPGQYHDSHIAILLRSLMIMETLWQVTTPPSPGLVLGPEMLI